MESNSFRCFSDCKVWDNVEKKMYGQLNALRLNDPNNFPPFVLVPDGKAEKRLEDFIVIPKVSGVSDSDGKLVWFNDIIELSNGEKWIVKELEVSGLLLMSLDFYEQDESFEKLPVLEVYEKVVSDDIVTYQVVGNLFENKEMLPDWYSEVVDVEI